MNDDPMTTAERIEAKAWLDLVAAAPPALTEGAGLRAGSDDAGSWVRCAAMPVGLLNRRFAVPAGVPLEHLETAVEGAQWLQLPEDRSATIEALRARGFVDAPMRSWTKVGRRTDDARPADERVGDVAPAEALAWAEVICTAHEMPRTVAPWTAALVGRPRWHCHAVRDGGEIVAGAVTFIDDGVAWLGLGGTLPAYRRRGAQTALLHARVVFAARRGIGFAVTETGTPQDGHHNPSLANMFRTGFTSLGLRMNLVRPR